VKAIKELNFKLFKSYMTFTEDIKDENFEYLQPKYSISIAEIGEYFDGQIKKDFPKS